MNICVILLRTMFKRLSFIFALSLTICLFLFSSAQAAPPIKDTNYAGKFVSQSVADPIEIEAGKNREVTIKIKNIGTKIWYSTGANFVSAYTVDPNYHASMWAGASWIGKDQAAKISAITKPGSTAEIKIKLFVPKKVGEYSEKFYLAAENKTWIKGSGFFLKIKVVPAKAVGTVAVSFANSESDESAGNSAATIDASTKANDDYAVSKIAASANDLVLTGGQVAGFNIRYYNIGKANWKSYSWIEAGSRTLDDGGGRVNIADTNWIDARKILERVEPVNSKQSFNTEFTFRAPAKAGKYILRFQLMANGHTLNGGIYELPVTVVVDAPSDYQAITFASNRTLITEPNIRVGLYKADKPVKFMSDFEYQISLGKNLTAITLSTGTTATLSYKDEVYSIKFDDVLVTSTDFIRMVPLAVENFFELPGYERLVSWKGKKNFNVYRGVMEYRYSPKSDAPFVINELPLDLYIGGIAETSNAAAMEYIKALLVAARSYAYFHINNGVPTDQRMFDVYATTADQLYLGYNSELLMPRVVQAANNTYGEMVTYNNEPVVTPYFGNSNGKTKTWKEVWGGVNKPWIVPVECIYDKGKKMYGHGVGMSAADAAVRADKDGWTYVQLLQYYYAGVEVEKIY